MASCAASAQSANFSQCSRPASMSAASLPESMKRPLGRAVWAASCPPHTRDKSKSTYACPAFAQRMDRGFCPTMLVIQSALYGTFTAQNFVLWFLFYEMSLVPAFLLIKIWGGENRDRAATKFFLYTFLGSVAMLLSFLGIYFAKGSF